MPQNEVQQIIDSRLAAILEKELQTELASQQTGYAKALQKRSKSNSGDIK